MKSLLVVSLATAALITTCPATAATDGDHATTSQDSLVKRGAYVSRLGDCAACHTAPQGKPFAGGLPIDSNLGTIYSTNITPDKENGIGGYSEQEFADAVRNGVRKDGAHLYPAMPYPSYKKISDRDMQALYAYFQHGVAPVHEKGPVTDLSFPFSQRWGMMFWNWLFDSSANTVSPSEANDAVRRGAYLVEGLGHCGSCHTPRGLAMQEKAYDGNSSQYLAGSELNGWPVPSLRAGSGSHNGISGWSKQDIVDYLGKGRNAHAAVGGEMTKAVKFSTAHMTDADLQAIAAYLKTLPADNSQPELKDEQAAQATTQKLTKARDLTAGERAYIDNCAACHLVNGKGASNMFPALDGNSLINADSPHGLLATILEGAQTPSVKRAPSVNFMPGFADRLSDQQVADLATFLRQGWRNDAGRVSKSDVAEVREALKKEQK